MVVTYFSYLFDNFFYKFFILLHVIRKLRDNNLTKNCKINRCTKSLNPTIVILFYNHAHVSHISWKYLVLLRNTTFLSHYHIHYQHKNIQSSTSKCDWNKRNQHVGKIIGANLNRYCHDNIAKWHFTLISFAFFAWKLRHVWHTSWGPHRWGTSIVCMSDSWHCWGWWRDS
jgi:hypothetical protein